MKKIAIELLIAAATVMAYVLPVLAEGGGCYFNTNYHSLKEVP